MSCRHASKVTAKVERSRGHFMLTARCWECSAVLDSKLLSQREAEEALDAEAEAARLSPEPPRPTHRWPLR